MQKNFNSKKYYTSARGKAFELKQLIILESRCVCSLHSRVGDEE